jgi:hypothetical protein
LSDAGHGSKAASVSKLINFPVFEMQWKIFSAKRPNRLGGYYNVDVVDFRCRQERSYIVHPGAPVVDIPSHVANPASIF